MTDLNERFDELSGARPPDLWPDIEQRTPRRGAPDVPSTTRRIAVGALALLIAAAAIGFAVWRLRPAPTTTPASTSSARIAFVGAARPEPSPTPEGGVIVGGTGGSGAPLRQQVFSAASDGSDVRQLTDDSLLKGSVAWDPTDGTIAYTAFDRDRMVEQLFIIELGAHEPRLLCEACTGTFFVPPPGAACFEYCDTTPSAIDGDVLSWSPDGRSITTRRTWDSGLSLIDASTGDVRAFATDGPVWGTSWSPDGSSVAVIVDGQQGGLFVLDVAAARMNLLDGADPYTGGPPAWSPDGSIIAFPEAVHLGGDLHAELVFIDPTNGDARTIIGPDQLFEIYDLDWSPDGSRLAVLHHPVDPPTAALLTVAADGSDVQMVALCDTGSHDADGLCPPNGGNVDWSPDGRNLLFDNFASVDEGRVLISLADDGVATALVADYVVSSFAWRPT
jgi:Tol biopolymer transport system component